MGRAVAIDAMRRWMLRHGARLIVAAVLVFVIGVRLRLADVPLERDEGEYAYAGQLILQGIPPYALAYNMKFPGTYYAYAAILAVFGQSPWGVHMGLIVVHVAAVLLLFAVARRLAGEAAAAAAASTFAIMALDRFVNGAFAHATHFVVLFALAGVYALLRVNDGREARGDGRLILAAGLCFGLAVLMKQHAIFYVPFAWLVLMAGGPPAPLGARAFDPRRVLKRTAILGLGIALPLLIVSATLATQHVFGRFKFWTFDYARAYVSEQSWSDLSGMFARNWYGVHHVTTAVWYASAAGLALLWLTRWPMRTRLIVSGLSLASCLAVCPGFYFRPHYFILVLPCAALCMGVLAATVARASQRVWPRGIALLLAAVVPVAVLGRYISDERAYLFEWSASRVSREVYKRNPFVEAPVIAAYIEARTRPDDRIAVLGNEPEIPFYAHRRSATGYIYTYPLMEPQPYAARMQREMMQEVEAAQAPYLVDVGRWSWNVTPESDRTILDWADRYIARCYTVVGVMDLTNLSEPTWLWDEAMRGYEPTSDRLIHIYRWTGACR